MRSSAEERRPRVDRRKRERRGCGGGGRAQHLGGMRAHGDQVFSIELRERLAHARLMEDREPSGATQLGRDVRDVRNAVTPLRSWAAKSASSDGPRK